MTFRQIIGFSILLTLVLLVFCEITLAEDQQGSLASFVTPALLTLLLSLVFSMLRESRPQTHWLARIVMTSIGLSLYWTLPRIFSGAGFPILELLGIQLGAIAAGLVVWAASSLQIQHET